LGRGLRPPAGPPRSDIENMEFDILEEYGHLGFTILCRTGNNNTIKSININITNNNHIFNNIFNNINNDISSITTSTATLVAKVTKNNSIDKTINTKRSTNKTTIGADVERTIKLVASKRN